MAQAIRASLLASAMAATLVGRRANTLTVLLFLVPFQKLQVSGATRARAAITGLVVLSYVILVYLIFFLTYIYAS